MKIVLLQNFKSLGNKGDIKEVTDGYARNFLLPKKIAQVATKEAIEKAIAQKKEEEIRRQAKQKELQEKLEKLEKKKIIIQSRQKDGKLFGSITAKNIITAFKKENLDIPINCIIIKEPIKKIGKYEIEIKLSEDIKGKTEIEIKSA